MNGLVIAAGNERAHERLAASVAQVCGVQLRECTPSGSDVRLARFGNGDLVTADARSGDCTLAAYGSGLRRISSSTARAADALLARYRQHGDRFLDGTDPDIVATVVDARDGEILLAAGTGTHRWFVATTAEGFVASTHPATAEAARVEPPAVDRGDEDFLLSYAFVPDGRTVLDGVRVLGPGTTLRWPSGAVTEPPPASRPQSLEALDEDRAADQLFELLLEVVDSQAAGEHAHAVMLGGFDSALVAALLARLGHEVHTFTFHFEDESYNQANVATVVDHIGAQHTSVPIGPDLVAESLRGFARVYTQPVAQPHYLLHTLAASTLVRDRGLRHIFSGDGCDAVFLGYPTVSQRAALVARMGQLPKGLLTAARRALSTRVVEGVAGRLTATKARGVLEHAALEPPERGHLPVPILDETARRRLRPSPPQREPVATTRARLASRLDPAQPMRNAFDGHALTGASRVKVDGAVAATGIPQSSPFLDPRVRSFGLGFPAEALRSSGERAGAPGKRVLVRMSERTGILPAAVVHQRKQSPASAPIDDWYRGPLRPVVTELLGALPFPVEQAEIDALLRESALDRLYRQRVAGLGRHILQSVGLLASYGSFGALARDLAAATP